MNIKILENKLKIARSLDEINLVLQQYLAHHHITTYTFTYYSYYPNALNKLKDEGAISAPSSFLCFK